MAKRLIHKEVHDEVKQYYGAAARAAGNAQASCCTSPTPGPWGAANYDLAEEELPTAAALASLGCGNPIMVAELRQGETVLDLGSGGGIDVLLSARRVGDDGFVYGLDMTPDMLELARRNALDAGATNVEFLEGTIEQIPLPEDAVDVIISNCVINLSPDKGMVFGEMFRVLRPGGRIGVSDVVTDDALSEEEKAERGSFAGCISGALGTTEYHTGLEAAGFQDVEVRLTAEVTDGIHTAIIRATKPATGCCA